MQREMLPGRSDVRILGVAGEIGLLPQRLVLQWRVLRDRDGVQR